MRHKMRYAFALGAFAFVLAIVLTATYAQPGGKRNTETASEFVDRMMAFDKNKDGKLTKEELTDTRLHGLFDRADSKKVGIVTREELEALFTRESLQGGGFDGKDGKKGKGKGPGGDKKKDAP